MSNGTTAHEQTGQKPGLEPTLDGLFRRAAVRDPDALALIDPANRSWFTDGDPLSLTFSQADRIVWAIAARLHALGLRVGDVVAVQLPNTVESILTFLGIQRAGMIAALLPMLWRDNEIVAALSGTGAKAIITTARIGESDHCDIAVKVAVKLFSIRHVCAFGANLPDGISPLDDLLTTSGFDLLATGTRGDDPAAEMCVMTFEPSARGIAAVPRTNLQIMAGGLHLAAAAELQPGAAVLSATPISSFAGLCTTLLPPLLLGGRLVLHQPFDAASFVQAQVAQQYDAVILPGPLIQDFIERRLLVETTRKIIASWRAPERTETAPAAHGTAAVTDLRIFGETALIATPRTAEGEITPLTAGKIADAIELKRTDTGRFAVRGAMVGQSSPANDHTDAFVDTGYPCRIGPDGRLIISGPRSGMIGLGGYAIARNDLDALATVLEPSELVTSLPDALLGQRLAASSRRANVEALLIESGVNPLVAGAFRPRRAA